MLTLPQIIILCYIPLGLIGAFELVAQANKPDNISKIDQQLRELINKHKLKGQPNLDIPRINPESPIARLGRRLFFSVKLSGDQDIACVTCHHPALAGGDALSLPIGINAVDPKIIGPGRMQSPESNDFDGGPNVPRNSPSTFNTVFYSKCMFWDCRVEALGARDGKNGLGYRVLRTPDTMMGMSRIPARNLLEAQASFPVTSEHEMRGQFLKDEDNGTLRNKLASRFLEDKKSWIDDFQAAFGKSIPAEKIMTFENIARALAAYQASQTLIDHPWNRYVKGDVNAISNSAKQGARLFFTETSQGGYACYQCHSGDFFTDEQFHVTAVPQIGKGKEDGKYENNDYGRYILSGNPDDKFAFRTPSLLNVEATWPYGHSGAYKDLREMIAHMINPQKAIKSYDFTLKHLNMTIQTSHAKENTRQALAQLSKLQSEGKSKLVSHPNVEKEHIDQLYEFLKTLTDPCVKDPACIAKWIP